MLLLLILIVSVATQSLPDDRKEGDICQTVIVENAECIGLFHCKTDNDCSDWQKCCVSNCGKICVQPDYSFQPKTKPDIDQQQHPKRNKLPHQEPLQRRHHGRSSKSFSPEASNSVVGTRDGECPFPYFLPRCEEIPKCSSDHECAPKQKCCPLNCGKICVDLVPLTCSPNLCKLKCLNGFKRNQNGCEMCKCIIPPNEEKQCDPIKMYMRCEYGFQYLNGCPIHKCQTEENICKGLNCPDGSVCIIASPELEPTSKPNLKPKYWAVCSKDEEPPSLFPKKEGLVCPPYSDNKICITQWECGSDDDCFGVNKICCFNGCGYVCTDGLPDDKKQS